MKMKLQNELGLGLGALCSWIAEMLAAAPSCSWGKGSQRALSVVQGSPFSVSAAITMGRALQTLVCSLLGVVCGQTRAAQAFSTTGLLRTFVQVLRLRMFSF